MKFYLGTHRPNWLEFDIDIPLFISYRTLRDRRKLKEAKMHWALDSGGFSELSLYGEWTIHPKDYARDIRIYEREIGNLDFCAIQDYMCEPHVLKKTGLSVLQHQYLTCTSYLVLKNYNPDTKFLPVLQGWTLDDYLRHIDLYHKFNIDLTKEKLVGLGSVCRRQSTNEIYNIVKTLKGNGIRMHGFGIKVRGLKKYRKFLKSADSLSWTVNAMWNKPLDECSHKTCANCFVYASKWYNKIKRL